jgi:predicted transcriptional regulator
MVQLKLRADLEEKLKARLSEGLDPNSVVEAGLDALADRDRVRAAVDIGWAQADAGDFVESSPESVIRRADERAAN